jgi:hypothetical protein
MTVVVIVNARSHQDVFPPKGRVDTNGASASIAERPVIKQEIVRKNAPEGAATMDAIPVGQMITENVTINAIDPLAVRLRCQVQRSRGIVTGLP